MQSKEQERQAIFDGFFNLLEEMGSFWNDRNCNLELITEDSTQKVKYSCNNGSYEVDVTNDTKTEFFNDVLKLLLKHCKELSSTKPAIDNYFKE